MSKRTLPQLDRTDLPYRPDRPAPATLIALQVGPPSETVAYDALLLIVTEAEARRQQRDFAHQLIEPRRRERLGAMTPDLVTVEFITDWLEAGWLAEQDAARGMPDPRRWARGALGGDAVRRAPPYLG